MSPYTLFLMNPWRLALLPLLAAAALAAGCATTVSHGGMATESIPSGEHNTFTKWVTTSPSMAGIVGGAVGDGNYAGEVLKYTPPGTSAVIEALYHFNGTKHSFTALVHVEQTGLEAVIVGAVTEGWLKGNQVRGEYTQIACAQAPGGTCFQGTLDIMGGSRD